MDKDTPTCIFFSNANDPKVIGTITLDSTYNTKPAKVDLTERNFTKTEFVLYEIKKLAVAEIESDTLFKFYNNTNFNIISPLQSNT